MKSFSKEHCKNLSKACKRRWSNASERRKQSKRLKGRKLSKVHCGKLSEAQYRRYQDPVECVRQSKIAKTIWKRQTYKRKISRARKASWQDPKHRPNLLAGIARNRKISLKRGSAPKPSKLQDAIFEILKKSIKSLKQEYRVDRLHIDIAFPGKKLALEVDGWTHKYYKKMEKSDKNRDSFLKSCGWKVLRVSAGLRWNDPKLEKSALVKKALRFFRGRLYA